tara:strand:- start:2690 stop:4570 length:1881 start_codon:yes stop_codon:yes gene_type:complete
MPLSKFQLRPGIDREGTSYDTEGGWFDVNLVRFNKGRPQKVGGWRKANDTTFSGTCRALHAWVSLAGTRYLGLGTTCKYYIEEGGTTFTDITPIRLTTGNNEISFAAANGSSVLTVTDTAHGAVVGDFVTYSGCASLGGLIVASVLNQEYEINGVTSVNVYTITAKNTSGVTVTANSSDSGNGQGTVVGAYQINCGLDVYVNSTGWGVSTWGDSTWGSSSSITEAGQLRLWTHDHFGQDLIINPRAGGVFYWSESEFTSNSQIRAVNLSTKTGANLVPTVGLQTLVSNTDRHVIVLGADPIVGGVRTGVIDPMLIAFSDQENALDFEPLTTNTAGDLRLDEGSLIVGAVKSRQEVLIWTDTALYSMQFIGPPYTFGINLLNNDSGLASPNAAVNTPPGVFWMGQENFYTYNGSVQKVPCNVLSYVFDDFNDGQIFKVVGFSNSKFDEVGWFYCSSNSLEIDRYVMYDYVYKIWTYGQLSRTAWLDEGIVNYPRATSSNYLYQHEFGYNDDGSPMTNVFIESSDFDIGEGEQFAFLSKIIPDVKFLNNGESGLVNLVLKTRNFPGDSLTTNSTNAIASTTQQAHIRGRARQAVIRLESDDTNTNSSNNDTGWRLGATRIDVKSDGRR